MNPESLAVTIAVFATLSVILLLVVYGTTGASPTSARLRLLGTTLPTALQRADAGIDRRPGFFQAVLASIGQLAPRRNEKSISRLLVHAGIREPQAVSRFLAARALLSIVPAAAFAVLASESEPTLFRLVLKTVLIGAVGHVAVNSWLKRRCRQRVQAVTRSLPDVIDLLVVCLEAGIGLNAAIARVARERSELGDPLGAELRQVSTEIRRGRPRDEALHDLGVRNGVEELKSLTALMIQSTRLGASMGQTLRAHADLLRTKRRQRAEEIARKLPIKMLIPLATLLLPPLFVVIIGPAFLRFGEVVRVISGN